MDGTIPLAQVRSTSEICSDLERNLREHGLSHLSVEPMPSGDAETVMARVVDPSGTVVLAVSVNRATGLIRDLR